MGVIMINFEEICEIKDKVAILTPDKHGLTEAKKIITKLIEEAYELEDEVSELTSIVEDCICKHYK